MNKKTLATIIVALVIIAGAIGIYVTKFKVPHSRQAVFLTNGQVYFGKVTRSSNQFITLRDVYYLQQQDLRLQSGEKLDTKQINIIKLGEELHGPQDIMKINRDHVLFYETMRDDSKISQAIKKFVESGSDKPTSSSIK